MRVSEICVKQICVNQGLGLVTFWFEYDLTNYFFRYSHVVGRKESMQSNKPSWQAKLEITTAITACLWVSAYGRTWHEMLDWQWKISKLGKFSGLYEWNSIILYSGISSSFDKIVAKMAKTFQWNKISSKIGLLAKTCRKWPTFLTNVPKLPKIENNHCNNCLSVSFSLWADLTRNVKLTLKNKQIRQI